MKEMYMLMGIVENRKVLPFIENEQGVILNLSRKQMKEELLGLPKGVAGMVWHVGSDPSDNSFSSVVIPEALRHGFVSWIQGKTTLEDMNIEPHYFPDVGLGYDNVTGKIVLDASKAESLQMALSSEEGLDFHPKSAPGWHEVIKKAGSLDKIQLLKTHLVSPSCSRGRLTEELIEYQPFIYRALVRGHISQARKLAPRIVMSVDDPYPFSIDSLRKNLSIMFGDEFDEEGQFVLTETDIMRAVHCCGDYDMLGVMETGAIDVVHWNAWKYGVAPLTGRPDVLKKFIKNGGMFAWGGIPQDSYYLQVLGAKLGYSVETQSTDDYASLACSLEENREKAFSLICENYLKWLDAIVVQSGLTQDQIAHRTFISATCGYGVKDIGPLGEFAYNLSRSVAEFNRTIAQ